MTPAKEPTDNTDLREGVGAVMKDLRHQMLVVGRPRAGALTSIARQEGHEPGRRSRGARFDLYHVVKKGSSHDLPPNFRPNREILCDTPGPHLRLVLIRLSRRVEFSTGAPAPISQPLGAQS